MAGIARLASLVKPGGKIILYFADQHEVDGKCFYLVGSEMFFGLPLSKAIAVKCIEDVGFCDVKLTTLPREQLDNPHPNNNGYYFVFATKE